MKTLIELYNEQPVLNIFAATVFKPERVVFIGNKRMKRKRSQRIIRNYFLSRKITEEVFFETASSYTAEGLLELFRGIADRFPDCAVNLTGGAPLMIFAAGQLSKEREIPVFLYNHAIRSFTNILSFPEVESCDCRYPFKVEDFMRFAGGMVVSHGHFNPHDYDNLSDEFIDNMWGFYLKNKGDWNKMVTYIQHYVNVNSPDLHFYGKEHAVVANSVIYCCEKILNGLQRLNIITSLKIHGGRVSFCFANAELRRLLCDVGVWLELYTYRTALASGAFDDVEMSVVVDWNGVENEYDDVINEIDVVVTKGIVPMFISCKSGNVNTAALNEIKTLAMRFGGEYGKAVILTATQLSEESPRTYKRALNMDITVIERDDLDEGRLSKRLTDIIER